MNALLIGATGATGKDLLNLLIKDDYFQRVDIFVRRDVDTNHEKINVHVIDFDTPNEWKDLVKGDVLFSCLGTTLKAAGSAEAQWKIDYEYQYEFAKAARENGVDNYVLVSTGMASPDSLFFYTRMKGQLEEAVRALGFAKLSIFNPPVLVRKDSDRTGEAVAVKVTQLLNLIGLFRSQKPMPTEVLAKALINSAKRTDAGDRAFQGESIWALAKISDSAGELNS